MLHSADSYIGLSLIEEVLDVFVKYLEVYSDPVTHYVRIHALEMIYRFTRLIIKQVSDGRVSSNDVQSVIRIMGSQNFGSKIIFLTLKGSILGLFPPIEKIASFIVPWFCSYATFAPEALSTFTVEAIQDLNLSPAMQGKVEHFLRYIAQS